MKYGQTLQRNSLPHLPQETHDDDISRRCPWFNYGRTTAQRHTPEHYRLKDCRSNVYQSLTGSLSKSSYHTSQSRTKRHVKSDSRSYQTTIVLYWFAHLTSTLCELLSSDSIEIETLLSGLLIMKIHVNETDADVKWALVSALSDKEIDNLIYAPPSADERASYCNDAREMMTIARSKFKSSMAGVIHLIFAERTEAELRMQIEETFDDMLQLGNIAASNGAETVSERFLETIGIPFLATELLTTSCSNVLSDGTVGYNYELCRKSSRMSIVHTAGGRLRQAACGLSYLSTNVA